MDYYTLGLVRMSKLQLTCHYTQTTEITSSYLVAVEQSSDASHAIQVYYIAYAAAYAVKTC